MKSVVNDNESGELSRFDTEYYLLELARLIIYNRELFQKLDLYCQDEQLNSPDETEQGLLIDKGLLNTDGSIPIPVRNIVLGLPS